MSKKSNVSWVKPAEPSFLRKFKNDVGYKEGPTVDTKRQAIPTFDDDDDGGSDSDREDEMPQVVVLKEQHLTAEDVKKIKDEIKGSKEKDPPADGKIKFKKPTKRSSEKFQGITACSSKKKKSEDRKVEREGEDAPKKVKNNSLLSFGGDEVEDD